MRDLISIIVAGFSVVSAVILFSLFLVPPVFLFFSRSIILPTRLLRLYMLLHLLPICQSADQSGIRPGVHGAPLTSSDVSSAPRSASNSLSDASAAENSLAAI